MHVSLFFVFRRPLRECEDSDWFGLGAHNGSSTESSIFTLSSVNAIGGSCFRACTSLFVHPNRSSELVVQVSSPSADTADLCPALDGGLQWIDPIAEHIRPLSDDQSLVDIDEGHYSCLTKRLAIWTFQESLTSWVVSSTTSHPFLSDRKAGRSRGAQLELFTRPNHLHLSQQSNRHRGPDQ
jgi:hypothetical protein